VQLILPQSKMLKAFLRQGKQLKKTQSIFVKLKSSERCMSSGPALSLHYEKDVAIISMKNKDNRLNTPFVENFNSLLDSIENNESCKALITTGEGKFYSNGIDLPWISNTSGPELIDFLIKLNTLLLRIVMFPVPTLAMMNGHAFAGGAMLASAHDLRVMNKDKGWMCFNEVFLKIKLSELMLAMLRAKLGEKNLADCLVLGRRYTAAEAMACELIHNAFPGDALQEESLNFVQSFVGMKDGIPRDGVLMMKKHIYPSVELGLKTDLDDGFETHGKQFMNESQMNSFKSK